MTSPNAALPQCSPRWAGGRLPCSQRVGADGMTMTMTDHPPPNAARRWRRFWRCNADGGPLAFARCDRWRWHRGNHASNDIGYARWRRRDA